MNRYKVVKSTTPVLFKLFLHAPSSLPLLCIDFISVSLVPRMSSTCKYFLSTQCLLFCFFHHQIILYCTSGLVYVYKKSNLSSSKLFCTSDKLQFCISLKQSLNLFLYVTSSNSFTLIINIVRIKDI